MYKLILSTSLESLQILHIHLFIQPQKIYVNLGHILLVMTSFEGKGLPGPLADKFLFLEEKLCLSCSAAHLLIFHCILCQVFIVLFLIGSVWTAAHSVKAA